MSLDSFRKFLCGRKRNGKAYTRRTVEVSIDWEFFFFFKGKGGVFNK